MTNMMSYDDFKTLRDAMDFLDAHPAVNSVLGGCFFVSNLNFSPDAYCKNDVPLCGLQPQDVTVLVKPDHQMFSTWSVQWPDEVERVEDVRGNIVNAYMRIPYQTVYGCEWAFNCTNYRGDFRLFRASSDTDTDFDAYQGGSVTSPTFEKMVLDIAAWVETNFGHFCGDDFLTPEEKRNHAGSEPFTFTPDNGEESSFSMCDNPDYIYVPWSTINRRWWDWFIQTDHYKCHYQKLFKQD
jgi:hypothetical protein